MSACGRVIIVAVFVGLGGVECDPREDIFVPPRDVDPVRVPPTPVGEAEDTPADGQKSLSQEM